MSQNRSAAVMEQRAPAQVEADDAQRRRWRALDFFPTPPWAARAGAELVEQLDPSANSVLEPACGEGHIAEPLKEYFATVVASDIHDYGRGYWTADFLGLHFPYAVPAPDWVITNPPFSLAPEFIMRGLEVATRGVAVLCRMAFLESAARYALLFQGQHPLTVLAPFCERVPMQLGCWQPSGRSATAYAWFVFDKKRDSTVAGIMAIPPGTRDSLTMPSDATRFGARSAQPLFDGGEDAQE